MMPTSKEARERLPLAWEQYEASRRRLSVATAAYLRCKRLVKLLLIAVGKPPPPGPWHPKRSGRRRLEKGGGCD